MDAADQSGGTKYDMHKDHTEIQQLKDNNETPTMMVYAVHINEIKTLPLLTEEEWRQDTSEDCDLGYIKRILSSLDETPLYTK